MSMLSKAQFLGIEAGSMIEIGTIFEALSQECVVWVCQERGIHPERGTEVAVFGLVYEGIDIGRVRGELLETGEVHWKDLK